MRPRINTRVTLVATAKPEIPTVKQLVTKDRLNIEINKMFNQISHR